MSAAITDKITDVRNAARPNSARATGTRAAAGVSLACDNLAGWPTASKVHFVTYQVNSSSNPVAGTQLDCSGIVSGNTIGSFTVIDGTDLGNAVGDYVEMIPTAAWGQDLSDALTSTHNRSGGLKSGLTIPTPTLTTPAIADFTSATHTHATNAMGGILTASAFANNAITAALLATNAILLGSVSYTSTNSTASGSAVLLTGVTLTVTIPAGGRGVMILLHCPSAANTNANRTSIFGIWDGTVGSGTQLQAATLSTTNAAANNSLTTFAFVTPSAGSKTYNASYQTDGAGTLAVNASATAPVIMLAVAL